MFILLRKQHLKNMAHQPFSRIFLMTCYSVASAHIVPYIVLAARGLKDGLLGKSLVITQYPEKFKIENSLKKSLPVQKGGFQETSCPKYRQDGSGL